MLLGAVAGYIYGRIGMELLAREDQAKLSTAPQPRLLDYMLGWVLPVVLGFALAARWYGPAALTAALRAR